jgi:hypothetical protein
MKFAPLFRTVHRYLPSDESSGLTQQILSSLVTLYVLFTFLNSKAPRKHKEYDDLRADSMLIKVNSFLI